MLLCRAFSDAHDFLLKADTVFLQSRSVFVGKFGLLFSGGSRRFRLFSGGAGCGFCRRLIGFGLPRNVCAPACAEHSLFPGAEESELHV